MQSFTRFFHTVPPKLSPLSNKLIILIVSYLEQVCKNNNIPNLFAKETLILVNILKTFCSDPKEYTCAQSIYLVAMFEQ
jgi:hypothetical protein